jgi:hypothetical protein
MKSEYLRASVVTFVLLGIFMFTMSLGLEFVFDDHVAGLLAATATWCLPVLLSAQCRVRLLYRRGFFAGSSFGLVMMVFNIAYLIVGTKPHVFIPVAVIALMLPAVAINLLLERILFTAEERLEIESQNSRRHQIP